MAAVISCKNCNNINPTANGFCVYCGASLSLRPNHPTAMPPTPTPLVIPYQVVPVNPVKPNFWMRPIILIIGGLAIVAVIAVVIAYFSLNSEPTISYSYVPISPATATLRPTSTQVIANFNTTATPVLPTAVAQPTTIQAVTKPLPTATEYIQVVPTRVAVSVATATPVVPSLPTATPATTINNGINLSLTATLSDNPQGSNEVAFSPNNKYLASAGLDGQVRVLELNNQYTYSKSLLPSPSANDQIYSVNFSPNGKYLAVGTQSGQLYLLDGANFTIFSTFKLPGAINSLTFSADDHYLVTGNEGNSNNVNIMDVTSPYGVQLIEVGRQSADVEAVAFLPGSVDTFISGSADGTIYQWNVTDRVSSQGVALANNIAGGVWTLDFSHDGKTLAVGPKSTNLITLINLTNGQHSNPFGETGEQVNVAFSPDGKYLAYSDDAGNIYIRDAQNNYKLLKTFRPAKISQITTIAFNPNGQWLSVVGNSQYIEIWNVGG